jgi:peptidoglycan/xylan/chitin deacetylase (PgdA/CDA1 family)
MAGFKSQLFRAGLSALHASGAARALSAWTAGKGAILMMHRVQPASLHGAFTPNASLSITPEYLDALLASFHAAGVDVVTLDQALERIARRGATRRFVCLTFDDGYRDNLEHALPIFRRHGAPFTVYATSSFVTRHFAPWWYVLEHVIANNARVRWGTGQDAMSYDVSDLAAKYATFDTLSQRFFSLQQVDVRTHLQRLADDHAVSLPAFATREHCSFSELRALIEGGAEIGCHSVSHALLLRESDATVRSELSDARTELEAGLNRPVKHLAYPYGKRDHVGARELRIAKELGFASAVTTRKGVLFAIHTEYLHALPRVEVTPSFAGSPRYLHTILQGLPLMLWNHGRRAITD